MHNAVIPHDLEKMRPLLSPSGDIDLRQVTPTFYEDMDRDMPDFGGHILIQQYEFSAPWPTWEIHPKGDEFVYLLYGDVDFVLWENGAETIIHVKDRNNYVVVPRNTWHTARPRGKTGLLFITPGEGTLNADRPS